MLAAIERGDAEKLSELMRQDPDFDVNKDHGKGWTLLHVVCNKNSRSDMIPLLQAHPDINVNLRSAFGNTVFEFVCLCGLTSCVRELLKDSRVAVNEPAGNGCTPLWRAAFWGHLNTIKWWVASGREMNLGKPGDIDNTDAIGAAKNQGKTEVVTLLERFKENPRETRHAMRLELGLVDALAAEMFAVVVFVSDGLLQVGNVVDSTPAAARFFRIVSQLPLELQMILCYRFVSSSKEIISGKDSEMAFRCLAKRI